MKLNLIDEYERLREQAMLEVEKIAASYVHLPISSSTCKTMQWDNISCYWRAIVEVKYKTAQAKTFNINYLDGEMSRLYNECNINEDMHIVSQELRKKVIHCHVSQKSPKNKQ